MSSSLPAGFGHYELFDDATFGEQQLAELLSLYTALESYPDASKRDIAKQLLRTWAEEEARRKAQRKAIEAAQRRCAEAEDTNAALERSARRSKETVARTHTRSAADCSTVASTD